MCRQRRESVKFEAVYERDGGLCQVCSRPVSRREGFRFRKGEYDPDAPTIDHIVPLSVGGEHAYRNVRLAHTGCNSRRGNDLSDVPRDALLRHQPSHTCAIAASLTDDQLRAALSVQALTTWQLFQAFK